MLLLIIFLVAIFVAIGAGVLAGYSDMRGLTIPNSYSLIIGAAFVAAYVLLALFGRADVFAPLLSHILAGIVVFVITVALFATRVMGGADSKLASVYALWMGLKGLPAFLFYMAVVGGVLGLAALVLRKYKPIKNPKEGGWVARVQAGDNKVPYGVAIACGALASFVKLGYLGVDMLGSFLAN